MALDKENFNALMLKGLRRAGETHSLDDVVQALHRGHMQVLYNEDAAIVTQITQAPRKRVLDVFMALGELGAVAALSPDLIERARSAGAEFGRAYVRPGLVDPLKAMGWTSRGEVMFYKL